MNESNERASGISVCLSAFNVVLFIVFFGRGVGEWIGMWAVIYIIIPTTSLWCCCKWNESPFSSGLDYFGVD